MATATEPHVVGEQDACAAASTAEGDDRSFPITNAVFEQMIEAGLIPEERRVFLWGGRLCERMAKTNAHAIYQNAILDALKERLPRSFHLGGETPIVLADGFMPLPDLTVLRGRPLDYLAGRPTGRDVVLVVEVAVTSLRRDLGPRLSLFARSLPEATYLVVDAVNRRLLVHRNPGGETTPGYGTVETVGPGQSLTLRFGDVELPAIPFEEILG